MNNPQPKKTGRRGKLTEELSDNICKVIAETGSDRLAYETYGVSHESFYNWLKKFPEFLEKVESARKEFQQKSVDNYSTNKKLAEQYITQVLAGTFYKKKRRQVLNKQDEIITLVDEEQVIPSDALLERVLGRTSIDPNPTFVFKIGDPTSIDDRTPGDEEEILALLNLESDGNADLS